MSALDRLKAKHGTTMRLLLRANGAVEVLDKAIDIGEAHKRINAAFLDTVTMLDRKHVLLVNDNGVSLHLAVNEEATRLYLDRCIPGTTHQLRGDALLLPDSDFAAAGSAA